MDNPRVVVCGGAEIPSAWALKSYKKTHLATSGKKRNINLRITDINDKLWRDISDHLIDLLEITAYVYSADQVVGRGGNGALSMGEKWRRDFKFTIPVRSPDLWSSETIQNSLEDALGFLSGDTYEFHFERIEDPPGIQAYLDIEEGPAGGFSPDEICLFSGGLDSLGGAIQELLGNRNSTILVSHSSLPKVGQIQRELAGQLSQAGRQDTKLLHIPVRINKHVMRSVEETQRSRSFLYASLAATVARVFGLSHINFYENGVTSLNLPIAAQVVGTKATRSTHPQALRNLSDFFTNLFGKRFEVSNPFIWKTKAEVVEIIRDSGQVDMIKDTFSCSYPRTLTHEHRHCGECSQCIDRRFAILAADCDQYDPGEKYRIDLLIGERKEGVTRTMLESYVKFANQIEDMNDLSFFPNYPELARAIDYLDSPPEEAASNCFELFKRHSGQVANVIDRGITKYSPQIRKGLLPDTCLIKLVAGRKKSKLQEREDVIRRFPTPEGAKWDEVRIYLVSNDSIEIVCRGRKKRYLYSDIGFRDKRKRDLPDDNWEALVLFAEYTGTISWEDSPIDPKVLRGLSKRVQTIGKRLREVVGIEGNPFNYYREEKAYKTRFIIEDRRSFPSVRNQ